MNKIHAKSHCCREKIYHYGNRRRQCSLCGRTWTIRQKRRGRKRRRIDKNLLIKVLIQNQSLKHIAEQRKLTSWSAIQRRFRKALIWFVNQPRNISLPEQEYILIGDGFWHRFAKQDWVLYLIVLKPINKNFAILMDPVLLPGKESYETWQKVVRTIPLNIRRRIKAFVSDDFSASQKLSLNNHWIHQLCHFHLIAHLQIRRGRKKINIIGKNTRETIYQTIRKILTTRNSQQLKFLTSSLKQLTDEQDCPDKLRMIVNEFLRKMDCFRAYLNYPGLNLPITTGSIETIGKMIRRLCRTIKNPEALRLWITAFIRLRSKITCNGKNFQQN